MESEDQIPGLILDAGNIFSDRPLSEPALEGAGLKAELLLKAMERMDYSATAIGEMDLYLGLQNLINLSELTSVRFLSANLVDGKGDRIFEPNVTLRAGDLKVTVIGLTQPPARKDLFKERMGESTVRDPFETAARLVSKVRAKSDLLVILSNLGYAKDLELARRVKGIDIIIGGRSRHFMRKPVMENGTLITSGYYQGRSVGKLVISYRGTVHGWISREKLDFMDRQIRTVERRADSEDGRIKLNDLKIRREAAAKFTIYDGDMINLIPSFPDDAEVASMIREYRRNLTGSAKASGTAGVVKGISTHYTGPHACDRCHESRYRFWIRTPHADAYDSLSEKEAGADPDCLPCHVTGYRRSTGYKPEQPRQDLRGVTCESCHGIGSLHISSPELYSLVRTPAAPLCLGCHTKDQDDDFNFLRDREMVCDELQKSGVRSQKPGAGNRRPGLLSNI